MAISDRTTLKGESGIKIGLALGGGGARGLAHIGVLKALEEEHIPIHLIVGTSMGSIIEGMYALNPNARELERQALEFLQSDLFQRSGINFLAEGDTDKQANLFQGLITHIKRRLIYNVALSRESLLDRDRLLNLLDALLGDHRIEETSIAFATMGVDLVTGQLVVLDRGSMKETVYASSAVEGIWPPLRDGKRVLADGGPVGNVPVEVTRRLEADLVIAVDITESMVAVPRLRTGLDIMFRRAKECIRKGEEAARQAVPEIRQKMEELRRRKRSFWGWLPWVVKKVPIAPLLMI